MVSIEKGSNYDERAWACFITEFEKLLNAYDLRGFIEKVP